VPTTTVVVPVRTPPAPPPVPCGAPPPAPAPTNKYDTEKDKYICIEFVAVDSAQVPLALVALTLKV
jgi:hypothetical protein